MSNSGLQPNSVMLASTGTGTAAAKRRNWSSCGQCFGKDHVRPGLDVTARPIDGGIQPFDGRRVGAGHDHEVRIAAGVDRGLEAVDHHLGRHELFAGTVAAAFAVDLVLQVDASHAGAIISAPPGRW